MIYLTEPEELNTAGRTLHMALRLLAGEQLRTSEAAKQYNIRRQTAYRNINAIALLLPVDIDQSTHCWRLLTEAELAGGE